ncbi:AMIN domain-containing protein [Maridesulfovibrio sp.]|uniref:AMIN domain-containing protein n=1 Tax=Maridesulfovibrio sp. TaxID=2795000 RepID=UPI0029C9EC30|nr:AMIN domain-containing protein [Maridesulfovibrio sp.]
MKMKFRPFTALLLVLLLLAGVCAVLYHTGFFNAFLVEKAKKEQLQEGDGPVVRRPVEKLVLPLKASTVEDSPLEDGLNEADISAGNSSVTAGPAAESAQKESETVPAKKPQPDEVVAETASKLKPEPTDPVNSAESISAKGALSGVSVSCQAQKATVKIALSAAAGKISWFNLDKPRRLVVDLHGQWANKAKSLYKFKDCPLQKVVLGEHPGKLRLVLYLDQKVPSKIKPVVRRNDKGISLELDF